MGFSEACEVQAGEAVVRGGLRRKVCGTCHRGQHWPYFLLYWYPEVLPSEDEALPPAGTGYVWVSWQTCG